MILLNNNYNKEKFRDELLITNTDCGLVIYQFVKYNDLIKDEFIQKVKKLIEKYYKDDSDSYKLAQLNEDIKSLCKKYNVINLKI